MGSALITALLMGYAYIMVRQHVRTQAAFAERHRPAHQTTLRSRYPRRHRPGPTGRGHTPVEPGYQFPGVPAGWSLDRYAADGLNQLRVHLAQSARQANTNHPN